MSREVSTLKNIDFASSKLLSNSDYILSCKEKRRSNLDKYVAELDISDCPVKFSFSNIPQVYPIVVHSNHLSDSTKFVRQLRRLGIGAFNWPGPEMPIDVMRDSNLVNAKCLG